MILCLSLQKMVYHQLRKLLLVHSAFQIQSLPVYGCHIMQCLRLFLLCSVLWHQFQNLKMFLYVFDWQNVTLYHVLSMLTMGTIALLLYLYKITETGDVFAVISVPVVDMSLGQSPKDQLQGIDCYYWLRSTRSVFFLKTHDILTSICLSFLQIV